MAVIIPMAKMPNNCEECDLKGLCPDYWKKIREEYTRPSWCQLDDLDATTFCGVPMEEAVEVMRMYKNGELVHLADRKTENSSEKPNNCKAQTDYDKGLQLFADILFDKEKSEQFLKECKAMGIEPQTDNIKVTCDMVGNKKEVEYQLPKCEKCINYGVEFTEDDSIDTCLIDECHYEPKDEPQTDAEITELAKEIVHKMIDNSVIAEDTYPDLRQRMHEAVERLDEYYPSEDERSE